MVVSGFGVLFQSIVFNRCANHVYILVELTVKLRVSILNDIACLKPYGLAQPAQGSSKLFYIHIGYDMIFVSLNNNDIFRKNKIKS